MSDKESTGASPGGGKLRMETAALIELVRQRPCLWDRGDAHYRARGDKERAWREVYRGLDPSYGDMTRTQRHEFGLMITRKWANIRDSYKKSLNSTSRASANSRPYLYANLLTFLDVMYKENKGKNCYENKDSEHEPDEEQEWLNEVFVDMDPREQESPEPKRIKTEFPRTKENSESEENLVSVLVNLIEKEEDEDRAFFKSIIPAVKSLSSDDKFLFRIRVMKLLEAMKKKEKLPPVKKDAAARDSDTD